VDTRNDILKYLKYENGNYVNKHDDSHIKSNDIKKKKMEFLMKEILTMKTFYKIIKVILKRHNIKWYDAIRKKYKKYVLVKIFNFINEKYKL